MAKQNFVCFTEKASTVSYEIPQSPFSFETASTFILLFKYASDELSVIV